MFTQPALKIYNQSLLYHLNTLGESYLKHKGSEEIYLALFDILHNIAEGEVAMNGGNEEIDLYGSVEKFKSLIKDGIESEEDEGMKNRLISAYDQLQILCKKIEGFINDSK